MNITIVCDVLGKENNGTTIAAMNLIRFLKERGHNVKVVCPDQDRIGQEGFYVVPLFKLGPLKNYVARNGVTLAKADHNILFEAIRNADVVHVMIPFVLGNTACRMAKKMGIKVTAGFHMQAENFTSHIFMKNFRLVNNLVYRIIYHKLYQYVDGIHYPTEFIRNVFENRIGKTKGYVISNGVNKVFVKKEASKPEIFKDKFVILFTGRYSKEKSHKVLLKAISAAPFEKDVQLIFAGDGPLKKRIVKYAQKHLTNQPVMKLFTRSELIDVINYADLYVHPAEVEIEAIACLEALSCGLVPVIANSPKCATKYFALDDRNLFMNKNSKDLIKKITYWMEHPDEKALVSQKYLGYANKFEHEHCMEEMEQMFYDVLNNDKPEGELCYE